MKKNLLVILTCLSIATLLYQLNLPDSKTKESSLSNKGLVEEPKGVKEAPNRGIDRIEGDKRDKRDNLTPTIKTQLEGKVVFENSYSDELVKSNELAVFKQKGITSFRLLGRGSKARIIDSKGVELLKSDGNSGIYGCSVSPDNKKMIVYYGDSNYDIITPNLGLSIRLPSMPPEKNMMGFSSWNWINDNRLIGVSYEQGKDDHVHYHNGHACSDPHLIRSAMYLFDLDKEKIYKVSLPKEYKDKIFSVDSVDSVGKVKLFFEGDDALPAGKNIGWFSLSPLQE